MSKMMEVNRVVAMPWHCDQFGHINVRWYAHYFDDASFQIWAQSGLDLTQMSERGVHTVMAQTVTDLKLEIKAGDVMVVLGGFMRLGTKSVKLRYELRSVTTGELHATQNAVEVFFDSTTRSSTSIPDDIRSALEPLIVTSQRVKE